MDASKIWRRLFARRQWPAAAEPCKRERESLSMREHCLRRLLSQGMPLWSEEPEHCDGCGRELLLGERARLLCRGDALLACPLCAERLLAEDYLAITSDVETDAVEDRGFSLAG